jgi:hypothetical protein
MCGLKGFEVEIVIYFLWVVVEIQSKYIYLVFIFTSKLVKYTKDLYNLALKL